ncbi:MAG: hypothetical protein AABX59_00435 [Nanoarchaeota archaeon]
MGEEMKIRKYRELYLGRIFLAFIISTIVFVLFFIFAYSISYLNYQKISSQSGIIENSIVNFEETLGDFECNNELLIDASERFDDAAQKLNLLEKRFGKQDRRVLELKERYSELEYRHFLITKKFNLECNTSYITVFFFYSNRNDDKEEESERMGFILTAFERREAEKIMIYALDFDLNIGLINGLKEQYNVTRAPFVVINEKDIVYVRHINELEKYL